MRNGQKNEDMRPVYTEEIHFRHVWYEGGPGGSLASQNGAQRNLECHLQPIKKHRSE